MIEQKVKKLLEECSVNKKFVYKVTIEIIPRKDIPFFLKFRVNIFKYRWSKLACYLFFKTIAEVFMNR